MKSIGVLLALGLLFCSGLVQAQQQVSLTISETVKQGGKIYVSIFNSEKTYSKRQIFQSYTLIPQSDSTIITLDLPLGEYLFSVYQDLNNNCKLNCNLIGIPKEPFGFSNYDGKSIPGDFHKLKVQITKETTELLLGLVKI